MPYSTKEKQREYDKKYRELNKEKIREKRAEHYQSNKEKIRECNRKYRELNKEKMREKSAEYYQLNKEKRAEYARKYREENREYTNKCKREYRDKRRAHCREYLGGKCVKCGTTHNLQFDHIKREGKKYEITRRLTYKFDTLKEELDKCQLLCAPCHLDKTTKEWEDMYN